MDRQIGFNPELAAALKQARASVGMTQQKAAEAANVGRNWLDACEAGRSYQPDYDRLKRIARVYRIRPSILLRLAHYDVGPNVDEEDVYSALNFIKSYLRRVSVDDEPRAREVVQILRKELDLVAV